MAIRLRNDPVAAAAPVRLAPVALAWTALAVVVSGLVLLPYYGDQALYAVIGRDVVAGRVPYTGIWDIKQPGIFLWYGAVDAAFGPSTVVTRVLDVGVAVLTAVLVGRLLRGRVRPAVGRWVPVAGAAVLLLPVRALDLGQVEQLAVAPALAAVVLVVRGPSTARAVAAGLCIGVVAVLKLWVAAVPLVAVVVWLLATRRAAALPAVAAGAAVPVLAVAGWLAVDGALGEALHTWFVGPGQALAQEGARPVGRLVSGLGRYVLVTAPVLVLVALRLPAVRRDRDPLDLALLAWAGTGLLVIGGQLWWSYHWVLLTPALLALAARQLSEHRPRRPALTALALAAVPLLAVGVASPERPMALGNGWTAESRAAIADRLGSAPTARSELAAAGFAPGDGLYVLGDPTYQLVADAPVPVRLNGWTPELFTDAQWDELGVDLATARPTYVFLENIYAEMATTRGNTLLRMLDSQYEQVRTSDAGVWYRLTDQNEGD